MLLQIIANLKNGYNEGYQKDGSVAHWMYDSAFNKAARGNRFWVPEPFKPTEAPVTGA